MTFELNTRQLFLTYPHCPAAPKFVLDQFTGRLPIDDYIVAREPHKDGSPHIHCYIKLTKRVRCKTEMLDIVDEEGKPYHGNYQRCKNAWLVQKYCKKGGNYTTNMVFEPLRQAIDLAKAGDVAGAFSAVAESRPDMILMGGSRLKANLQMLASAEEKEDQSNFTEFINIPPAIAHWQRKRHTLWLYGPSGYGKTEYAKSLFNNPLLISHTDQLKKLEPHHDGVIFDDYSMCHKPREIAIHITDLANKRGINVKHGMVVIPKGLPRVFCSNVWIWPEDESGAIERRVFAVYIRKQLYDEAPALDNKNGDEWSQISLADLTGVNERLMGDG